MALNDSKRRIARDGAAQGGDSFDSFNAGNMAVAQSLDMSAVPYDRNGAGNLVP